ncbi:MAG: DUF4157 domain-containing protein, partial [Cyanobacteria bacterium P01_A01_bin.17]
MPTIQTKLTVGQPNDKYEREADRVAEQIMRMPAVASMGNVGTQFRPPTIQRMCATCDEEKKLQTKEMSGSTPEVTPAIASCIQSLQGSGQPLSASTRFFFESRFRHDFSKVQTYTDAISTHNFNARAYTVGHNIVFAPGQYAPETNAGKRLLAHELTHVVQQETNEIHSLQRLTNTEKVANLKSSKYAGNPRLERAFDNDPPLGIGEGRGESNEAVRLIQEGLVADGFEMPRSTKSTGNLDGVFGE